MLLRQGLGKKENLVWEWISDLGSVDHCKKSCSWQLQAFAKRCDRASAESEGGSWAAAPLTCPLRAAAVSPSPALGEPSSTDPDPGREDTGTEITVVGASDTNSRGAEISAPCPVRTWGRLGFTLFRRILDGTRGCIIWRASSIGNQAAAEDIPGKACAGGVRLGLALFMTIFIGGASWQPMPRESELTVLRNISLLRHLWTMKPEVSMSQLCQLLSCVVSKSTVFLQLSSCQVQNPT